ncbi:capsular polysaccharide transport system permease protein [Palleronia aestuarii]|uniref:Transport permease protein n=1 Tax=Palleronia aestuarii TaxID=568105 RepID=A0A2W7N0L7_9RHOB|nr:ABC transporter permease [Palleronia aestuarii]PZX13491.1 capsular polysaccharide transport system permease protein [Palleronia aestuarii]
MPPAMPETRTPQPGRLRRVNRSLPAFRAILALILREMSTRYGRSPGGYAWALLEPLGGILILSFGFSLLLRTPSLGNSFLLFYASGYLPFTLYQDLSNKIARSIGFSRALLYYPAVTWLDAVLARFVLNALTGILVTYVLLFAILAAADTRVTVDMGPVIAAIGMSMILGLGVGMLNCALMGLFPVWETVWSIAMRPLFIVSGVFFLYEDMPANVQAILYWVPLIHITGEMRSGIYPSYAADYVSLAYVAAIALICLVMGLILMGRYHRTILNA